MKFAGQHALLLLLPVFLLPTSGDDVCTLGKTPWNAQAPARFGLSISLRKVDQLQPMRCGMVSQETLQLYVAAQWVCEHLNLDVGNGSFVPGVQFGFDLLDDCRSPTRAVQYALDYVDLYDDCGTASNSTDTGSSQIRLGLVGPSRSSTAEETADSMRSIPLPIISPSATLASLTEGDIPHPNFFRTVPSDTLQMKAIIDILKKLHWTFVAVVYTDDNYGTMGYKALKEEAMTANICINQSIPIRSNTLMVSVVSELINTRQRAEGESMAVVYIGEKDKAENLIFHVQSLRALGLHFIMSDGVSTNTDVFKSGRLETGKNIALGSLTLAPSSVVLQGFEDYLNQRYRDVKEGRVQDDVIRSYLEESGLMKSSEPLERFKQISFVPLAVSAIWALAEATRQAHLHSCAGAPGVCPTLVTGVREGALVEQLRHLKLDFGTMNSSIAPEEFRTSGYVLEFDGNGDIVPKPALPDYAIFAYDDDKNADSPYTQVGSYSGQQLTLDMTSVRMLTKDGHVTSTLQTSVCGGKCVECADNGRIPLAHLNGSAYIIGIFSMHERNAEQPFKCGDFRNVSNDAVVLEAFLYAVEQQKRQTGIDFGAVAFDDCYSNLHIGSILSDFLSGLVPFDKRLFDVCVPLDKVVGMVGSLSSDSTLAVAGFCAPLRIPTISYAASSPDLDDPVNFPNFLRTVPSDVEQAIAMTELIKAMGWEYVGLLYVDNNYGTKGAQAFRRVALERGVCVASPVPISVNPTNVDEKHLYDAFVTLMQQSVKVVVFFGIDTRMADFLRLIESRNEQGSIVFIASEEWGTKNDVLAAGQKAARGSITFKVDNTYIDPAIEGSLRTRLLEKTPSPDDVNPWFSEFWQHVFDCNIQGGFNNIFSSNCHPNTRLSTQQVDTMLSDQRVKHVMNAVKALAEGLADARSQICEDVFPCPFLRSDKYAQEVFDSIKSQTVSSGSIKQQLFDQNGNGNIGFSIYNIQRQAQGYVYTPVGSYSKKNGLELAKEHLLFYSETGLSSSQLTALCTDDLCDVPECTAHTPVPTSTPLSVSTTDSQFRMADIVIIILLVIFLLVLLCCMCLGLKFIWQKFRGLKKTLQEHKNEPVYHTVQDTRHHPTYGNVDPTQPLMTVPLTSNPAPIRFVNSLHSPGNTLSGHTNPAFQSETTLNGAPSGSQNSLVSTNQRASPAAPPPLPNRPFAPPFMHSMSAAPRLQHDSEDMASQHNYYMTHSPSSTRELPARPRAVTSLARSLRSLQSCPEGPVESIPLHTLTPQHSDPEDTPQQHNFHNPGMEPCPEEDVDDRAVQYLHMTPSGQLAEQEEPDGAVTYSLTPQEDQQPGVYTYSLSPPQAAGAPQYLSGQDPEVSPREPYGGQDPEVSPREPYGRQDPEVSPRERSDSLPVIQHGNLVAARELADIHAPRFYTVDTQLIPPLRITPEIREQLLEQLLETALIQHSGSSFASSSPDAQPRSCSASSPGSSPHHQASPAFQQQTSHPYSGFYPASMITESPGRAYAAPATTRPHANLPAGAVQAEAVEDTQQRRAGVFTAAGGAAQSMQTGVYASISQLPGYNPHPHPMHPPAMAETNLSSTPYAQVAQAAASHARAEDRERATSTGGESTRTISVSSNNTGSAGRAALQQPQPDRQPRGEEQGGAVVTLNGQAFSVSRV